MFKRLFSASEIKKNLLISVLGTGIGQLIHLGITPVLSRIYTPEEFGQFSLFISLLGIVTSFSLLKFDLAIITADDKIVSSIKKTITNLNFLITSITGIIALILFAIGHKFSQIFLFLTFCVPVMNRYWVHRAILNKNSRFKNLSLGKLIENSLNGIVAIALGIFGIKNIGLFIGKIVGVASTYYFFKSKSKNIYQNKPIQNSKQILTNFYKFPKFSFPAELVGHLNLSTSIFLFSYFYSSIEVGFIGLTTRVLAVPVNFISISFFDVFKQKAVSDYQQHQHFDQTFFKFFVILSFLSVSMIAIIFFWGTDLFTWFFGESWYQAGLYAKYLTLLYAVRLVASSLVFSFEITGRHHINLIFQILYLIFGSISIIASYVITKNDIICIKTYSITLSILYLIHVTMAYFNSKKKA